MNWFNYAIIRYTPDYKRGETINVGLIVFKKNDVDVRILENPSKMRMFGGQLTQEYLFDFKDAIRELSSTVHTPEEKYNFLSDIAHGIISLSGMGKFLIDDLHQYEAKVSRLFNELVKPIHVRAHEEKIPRLTTELKHKFAALDILAKDVSELSKHKVVPNYPINEDMGLHADFLLKNGIFHVTEVVDFNVNDVQSKLKETSFKMLTFMQSKMILTEPVACYFVYSASAVRENTISQHLKVAEGYSDKQFNLECKEQKLAYFSLMTELAGTLMPSLH